MKDASINEGFHDRIEFAEKLFKQSEDYKELFQEWEKRYSVVKALQILLTKAGKGKGA